MKIYLSLVGQERGLVAGILYRGGGSRVLGVECEEGRYGRLEGWRLDDLGWWRGRDAGSAAGARLRGDGGVARDHGAVGEEAVRRAGLWGGYDDTVGVRLARLRIEREEGGGEGDVVAGAGGRHFGLIVGVEVDVGSTSWRKCGVLEGRGKEHKEFYMQS